MNPVDFIAQNRAVRGAVLLDIFDGGPNGPPFDAPVQNIADESPADRAHKKPRDQLKDGVVSRSNLESDVKHRWHTLEHREPENMTGGQA